MPLWTLVNVSVRKHQIYEASPALHAFLIARDHTVARTVLSDVKRAEPVRVNVNMCRGQHKPVRT